MKYFLHSFIFHAAFEKLEKITKNFNFRHWCKQYIQHYWSAKLHFFPIFRTHIVRNCLSYWVQLVIYLNSNDKHAAKKNLFKFNIFFDQTMLQFFSFKFWKIWKWGIHRTIQGLKKMTIIYKYIFWKMHMYVFFKRKLNSSIFS